MPTTKLWVDDIRNPPASDKSYTIARTYWEAIAMLESFDYDELFIDHDLGCFRDGREYTGYDVVLWLAERRHENIGHTPWKYTLLTNNGSGYERIKGVIQRYLSNNIVN